MRGGWLVCKNQGKRSARPANVSLKGRVGYTFNGWRLARVSLRGNRAKRHVSPAQLPKRAVSRFPLPSRSIKRTKSESQELRMFFSPVHSGWGTLPRNNTGSLAQEQASPRKM